MERLNFWWATIQFVLALVFIVNFLYFTMLHDRKVRMTGDQSTCFVRPEINHPIHVTRDTNMDYVSDGGLQFYAVFICGLLLNVAIFVQSLLACFTSRKCASCVRASSIMMQIGSLAYIVGATCVRYSHTGKVCSGDYLYTPVTLETRSAHFLTVEG